MIDIKGYENLYLITKEGTVFSKISNKFLKLRLIKGYFMVALYKNKDGSCKHFKVHRLVAQTFIPNPENKLIINHIDGNKLNNNVSNLEWCTSSENDIHAFKTGLRKYNPSILRNKNTSLAVRKFSDEDLKRIRVLSFIKKQKDIALEYNVTRQTINRVLKQDYKF